MFGPKSSLKKRKRHSNAAAKGHGKTTTKGASGPPEVDQRVLDILTGVEEEDQDQNLNSPVEEDTTSSSDEQDKSHDEQGGERIEDRAEGKAERNPEGPQTFHGWPNALPSEHAKKIKVTVLLENANLETVRQSGRAGGFVLLNSDDHRHLLRKTGRNANDARPDITHQCLLALLDSPLNKEGRLKVYVRTSKNVLIDVNSETRIPRTFTRFAGLMTELLEKLKVRGTSGSTPLLRVIRNPIVSHLPVGTRKVVCTYNTENVMDMREHSRRIADLVDAKDSNGLSGNDNKQRTIADDGEEVNILYVVGAMAHGKIEEDWADEYICISEYPLSAATVCSRITHAYECLFGIL
ncbi:Ribosomal RNA small subunit methyltransferase NEP1 [Gracilariopsis chorda]|uniref:Ribosomal RNA small subunit methyltransferase NEP1 n=1 Tax=Gracilariopsis chorda TaxID=448386 RepID=A0A2V3IUB1_9FLOR|nr:Ribosomal RNA small subunit methyltransferase NEP1 [Gracilariopsis chorda]|eukprot:PXF45702.1 Ribosomal RNA small subunit methyltransferase NEP1 [Gracilariopsis chorda]